MVKYEVLFIINAELEDDKKNAVIEMAKETISADGEVENVDVWGNKKLAYPIQKKNEGFYVLITFNANPDLPKELDRKLRISDDVLRYIIVNKEEK
ncbi:MAG: 30S ribosomal protein S6 [Clostridiales bacterium]|nr:30S ribosomal protein S6 [Clostridiales bacterium]